jgi:electron-transferring-flavoprotein dehydrogenase
LFNESDRETMEFDIVIVGAGPAGLSTAITAAREAQALGIDISICVLEKGSEVGAHLVSGAVVETEVIKQLVPDWAEKDAPIQCQVKTESFHLLTANDKSVPIPTILLPNSLHNLGNSLVSLGELCRWLAIEAEALGVEILTGFAAARLMIDENNNQVTGVITGDMGIGKDGIAGSNFTPGYALRASYTVLAEGCRGHLGKEVITRFSLDQGSTPQHYGLGIREVWEIPSSQHIEGHIMHTLGWPLQEHAASGGAFLYHYPDNKVAIGLITDLNYSNPWLSPYQEFQRMKQHPVYASILQGGKRLGYAARALVKGGLQSLPKLTFPGGVLVGDDAGTLNFLKLKGTHCAIQCGQLAGKVVAQACQNGAEQSEITAYTEAFANSSLYKELWQARNAGPAIHKFGLYGGSLYTWLEQTLLEGRAPWTLKDKVPDHATLQKVTKASSITYAKSDGVLSFDRLSSVYLSNTFHEEDQPCHLQLIDAAVPIAKNLPLYGEPAQRYCPAAVYEITNNDQGKESLQINAQNCVHCKTCDIKDPAQNICWVAPEGGGGPNYPSP